MESKQLNATTSVCAKVAPVVCGCAAAREVGRLGSGPGRTVRSCRICSARSANRRTTASTYLGTSPAARGGTAGKGPGCPPAKQTGEN